MTEQTHFFIIWLGSKINTNKRKQELNLPINDDK